MTKFLAFVGLVAILGAIAVAIFFFGGFYNVAGTATDPEVVSWALSHVRDASIERHAQDNPPLSLDDPTIVQAGARAFSERGCVNCHGGPGVDWAKFSEGMHPGPPDLKELANETSPQELFWVIKNGINMTGMPSFGAIDVPDQEIWSIVAFVKEATDRVGRRFQDLDPAVRMPHVKVTAECPEHIRNNRLACGGYQCGGGCSFTLWHQPHRHANDAK
jgi:mono/diheme cytochrome c family protein